MLALIKLWVTCCPLGLFAIRFVQQEPEWLTSTLQSMSSAGADFKLCQGPLSLLPLPFLSWHFVLSDLVSSLFSLNSLTFACSGPHASSICLWLELRLPQDGASGMGACAGNLCALGVAYMQAGVCVRVSSHHLGHQSIRDTHDSPHMAACTYVVRGQVRVEIVDSCEKTRTHEQSVNTCHVSSGKLLKKAPSVWASEDGEGVSAGPRLTYPRGRALPPPTHAEPGATGCVRGVKPVTARGPSITLLTQMSA